MTEEDFKNSQDIRRDYDNLIKESEQKYLSHLNPNENSLYFLNKVLIEKNSTYMSDLILQQQEQIEINKSLIEITRKQITASRKSTCTQQWLTVTIICVGLASLLLKIFS